METVDEYGIDLHGRDKDEWMMEQETGLLGAGELTLLSEIWQRRRWVGLTMMWMERGQKRQEEIGNFTQQITHGYNIRYTSNQTQS